jgi:small subunit ribosomal protein S6
MCPIGRRGRRFAPRCYHRPPLMAPEPALYDLVLLLDPTIDEERRAKILDGAEAMIDQRGGQIVGAHDWGVRPTAYEVRKHPDAEYHLLQFHANNELLEALDHSLKITDGILRFRVIKLRTGTPAPPDMTAAALAEDLDSEVQAEPEPAEV